MLLFRQQFRAVPNAFAGKSVYRIERRCWYGAWVFEGFAKTRLEAEDLIAHLARGPIYYSTKS